MTMQFRVPTAVLLIAFGAVAQAQDGGTRDARYCEIIPIFRDGLHLTAKVYNTFRHGDCPQAIWDSITEDAMKQRFNAVSVILNGPRHFVMDSIAASGATKSGQTIEAGGLALTERATLDLGLLDLLRRPYRETTVNVETVYTYKAGRPVFILASDSGSRYVMQSYAQIVDKTLSYDDLPNLGSRLDLPPGWQYSSKVPEEDLVLRADGRATMIEDGLGNTYQKLD
jgi:hypothetical protein